MVHRCDQLNMLDVFDVLGCTVTSCRVDFQDQRFRFVEPVVSKSGNRFRYSFK